MSDPRSAKPRVIACIAVRMNSTRLPRKALADIEGKPMLLRIVERLRTAKSIDRIVVCTSSHPDDAVLVELAEAWGIDAIAGNENDVLSRFIAAGTRFDADLVVRVTGDNVLTDPEYIDRLVELQQREMSEYARVAGLPLGVTAEVMTLNMMRVLHAAMGDPSMSEYLVFYAFDPTTYDCSVLIADETVHRPDYALTVDTPGDLELVRRLYRELPSGDAGPRLEAVIELLGDDPSYEGVPAESPIKLPSGVTWTFDEYLRWHGERTELARRSR